MNKYTLALLFLIVSAFSLNAKAIVFGNAKTASLYGEKAIIEIEIFNLYDMNYEDVEFEIIDAYNEEISNEKFKLTFKKSFIQSNGLGWLTLTSNENIFNGNINFVLRSENKNNKGKRKYKITLYGTSKNRPIKTCNFKSKRIKCIED